MIASVVRREVRRGRHSCGDLGIHSSVAMNIGYFEDSGYRDLLPLTWLRSCFELRCGRDTLLDKVRAHVDGRIVKLWSRESLRPVLAERYACADPDSAESYVLLNTRALITGSVELPRAGVAWRLHGDLVAAGVRPEDFDGCEAELFDSRERLDEWVARRFKFEEAPECVRLIQHPWDLILANEAELERQFQPGGKHAGEVHPAAHLIQPECINLARGARVKPGAVLDTEQGPIHLAPNVLIEPNAVIQGPVYIGPHSVIRPGAVIRSGTSIGPVCKVGGEVEGTIIHGYSNKQHDGFLGHSYLAQWVNLGADTITSDLKNTYGTIRVFINGVGVETGQHFVGSIIGDHSKTGIGTILPTGCVIGAAANIFTQGPVPKFVPSFSWLTDAGMTAYRVDKAVQIARTVMNRRDVELSDPERALLERVAAEARTVEDAGWPS